MQVQLDFFAAKERKERKDKSLCCFFFAIFTKILPRMARITRISFEQKGTKETKEEFFFVAFVCFCANSISRAARMGNSESVKSVKSVVHSLLKKGLTKIRNYGRIASVRHEGTGQGRLREVAAGAEAGDAGQSPVRAALGGRFAVQNHSSTPFLLHCASAGTATVIDRRYRMKSTPVASVSAAAAAIPMEVKIKANQGKST
jgi:hypothetical protein